ncbi:MAG TPA: protein translocase subunit SecF [Vicinamibacterales bacterium]|nr:protein translocase subunit SecF [Vicinamibacterales bacterium]
MRILTNVNIDWLRWRWHTLALSWLIIVAGLWVIFTRGLPLGIDFSGGTLMVVQFERSVTVGDVRQAIASLPGEEVVQSYGTPDENQILIRLPQAEGATDADSLERGSQQVADALQKAGLPKSEIVKRELVSAVIGADLQRKGIYATIASLVGIMGYIALRFRLSFGLGAMTASIHDVLITLSIMTFAGYELSLNVVAAILTLVGYGVNDQIVIFDRVRENLRSNRRQPMRDIINLSVNQTLPRTVITAGTVVLAVLSLYLFGGEVLEPFAFAMLVGVITSTYSTVFIASAVAVLLSPRPLASTVAAAPAPASQSPRQAERSGRKAGRVGAR